LSEGLLPPDLLRKAATAEFMPGNSNAQTLSTEPITAKTN
jgi:hypothetical protein